MLGSVMGGKLLMFPFHLPFAVNFCHGDIIFIQFKVCRKMFSE